MQAYMPTVTIIKPDYYKKFSCKCGACRAVCCRGWRITLTEKEYFRILGLNCSPNLRNLLDTSLRILEEPTDDQYAAVVPDASGRCRICDENGLCSLQCECGEAVLPSVCRMFPRDVCAGEVSTVALSASCEGVVELLMNEPAPLTWSAEVVHTVNEPDTPAPDPTVLARRTKVLDAFQQGADMAQRFANLAALCGSASPDLSPRAVYEEGRKLCELLGTYSVTLCDRAEELLDRFADFAPWADAEKRFAELLPDSDRYFANLITNWMYLAHFPDFHDTFEDIANCTPEKAFVTVLATYDFLRFFAVGLLRADDHPQTGFADTAAAVFRYIDHTPWTENVLKIVKN